MKKQEVIEFFGSRIAAAEALGITPEAISMWGDDVPKGRLKTVELAMELETLKRQGKIPKKPRKR